MSILPEEKTNLNWIWPLALMLAAILLWNPSLVKRLEDAIFPKNNQNIEAWKHQEDQFLLQQKILEQTLRKYKDGFNNDSKCVEIGAAMAQIDSHVHHFQTYTTYLTKKHLHVEASIKNGTTSEVTTTGATRKLSDLVFLIR